MQCKLPSSRPPFRYLPMSIVEALVPEKRKLTDHAVMQEIGDDFAEKASKIAGLGHVKKYALNYMSCNQDPKTQAHTRNLVAAWGLQADDLALWGIS
eukprot:2454338-Amphidinium_carterae.1